MPTINVRWQMNSSRYKLRTRISCCCCWITISSVPPLPLLFSLKIRSGRREFLKLRLYNYAATITPYIFSLETVYVRIVFVFYYARFVFFFKFYLRNHRRFELLNTNRSVHCGNVLNKLINRSSRTISYQWSDNRNNSCRNRYFEPIVIINRFFSRDYCIFFVKIFNEFYFVR